MERDAGEIGEASWESHIWNPSVARNLSEEPGNSVSESCSLVSQWPATI